MMLPVKVQTDLLNQIWSFLVTKKMLNLIFIVGKSKVRGQLTNPKEADFSEAE